MRGHLEEHVNRLYHFCLRLARDHHVAEDLTQESLLRAWRRRSGLRDPNATKVWLFKIATNLWRDRLRRSRHQAERPNPIGLTPDVFDGAAAMYELVDAVFHQKGYSEGPPILEVLTMIKDHLNATGV